MDHAFRSSHGVGFVDYQNNPDVRLQVEMKRERDYEAGQQASAQLDRLAHRDS
ncbi:hypothetical protein [Paenisporosarcina indica]|uniref:hypothetical protein n=1 Tax=Paenisporosarcina indica TaxID=650093 RepID=UPI001B7FFF60|nr:hypothetical protein [Paenisporosarcina indica]